MIFVTVGEQLPFERLIKAVDCVAPLISQKIIAQIGKSDFKPKNIEYVNFLPPEKFKEMFLSTEFIVSHAGMGSIITALDMGKPIIVMPRKASLGEHRNDHQLHTAKKYLDLNYISVAFEEVQLQEMVNKWDKSPIQPDINLSTNQPSAHLIKKIREFVFIDSLND